MGMMINCPLCPYYVQKTSYGTELIKCNNTDCNRRIEDGNDDR